MYVIDFIGTVQLVSLLSNRSEVESVEESLLGWKGGEEAERDPHPRMDQGGERCLYEYNLTLTFEPTMGRSPFSFSTFSLSNSQDCDAGPLGGGVDLLSFEAGDGCAGVWLRWINHLLQVINNGFMFSLFSSF